jgi:hypothetical protein
MKKPEEWTHTEEKLLRKLIEKRQKLVLQKDYDIKFISDLLTGEEAEHLIANVLSSAEVKRDFGVSKTGNVFVEFKFRNKDSGIAITSADYWIFVLDGAEYNSEVFIGIKTERLKQILSAIQWEVTGGDFNQSKGKLIKVVNLLLKNSSIKANEINGQKK